MENTILDDVAGTLWSTTNRTTMKREQKNKNNKVENFRPSAGSCKPKVSALKLADVTILNKYKLT